MRIGEQRATFGQPIDVRCVHDAFVPAETIHPVLHIINGEKQNIGLVLDLVSYRRLCDAVAGDLVGLGGHCGFVA